MACTFLFYYAANHQINYNSYTIQQKNHNDVTNEIVDGENLIQSFSFGGDYIEQISFMMGTYGRENSGQLEISLVNENGEIIKSTEIDASEIENDKYLTFVVEKEVKSKNNIYFICVESRGCYTGNSVVFYTNNSDRVLDGELTVGDTKLNSIELQMQVIGGKLSYRAEFFWPIAIIIGFLGATFFFIQAKKEKTNQEGVLHYFADLLYTYKFLIKQLVYRDFTTKYKRSVLGMCWSFLNPLLTMVVQYVIFSAIFRNDIENYPVYLLSASILFNFFTESVGGGLGSIVANASLIKKVYVPKYIYPLTKVLSTAINLLISLLPMLLVVLITGEKVNKTYILIPFILVCLIAFCVGMSLILGSLMVFFRDVQFIWGILSLLWMYATPMFYPADIIPDKFKFILTANPMYHYISFFRSLLMEYKSPALSEYIWCIFFSVAFCVVGGCIFKKTQKNFVLYL